MDWYAYGYSEGSTQGIEDFEAGKKRDDTPNGFKNNLEYCEGYKYAYNEMYDEGEKEKNNET